ncbi:hypothetical protein AAG570_002120 [Ranatra chinensis]|uniref:Uncharacterized protein n=1 Tax=Ranatra chinensis TaxID=642074 RepID=A0ABD0Y715_9HEMI
MCSKISSTNWQGQQSAAVGAALPPRQPYMSATLDGYQYRRHRKQQQYFPQQQQQQQQKLHWHSTTSPTTAQYPTGLLAPVKIPGRHTQSLSRTAPPTVSTKLCVHLLSFLLSYRLKAVIELTLPRNYLLEWFSTGS